ncbi:MAG: alginate lyase family protein [Ignavibacteriales bacterium]|nr:alginate lyase family protein [Ignavibacteriales bacterium]
MKTIAAFALVLILVCRPLAAQDRRPRVFLLDPSTLVAARAAYGTQNGELKTPIDGLLKEARKALQAKPVSVMQKSGVPPSGSKHDYMSVGPYWWPDSSKPGGVPYVRRDGETNPEHNTLGDRVRLGTMMSAVRTLAAANFITGDEQFARAACLQLQVWFVDPETRMNPNLNFAQAINGITDGRGIGIIDSYGFRDVIDAIGLLKGSASLTPSLERGLKEWFAAYLSWLLESKNGRDEAAEKNNHGTAYDVQVVSIALFLDKTALVREVLSNAGTKRIAAQIEPDGSQPFELARTKSWGYSVMNTGGLVNLALLGDHVGVDLWHYSTPDGRGIQKAIDFLLPYALKEKEWTWRQIVPIEYDHLVAMLQIAAVKYGDARYESAYERLMNPTIAAASSRLFLPRVRSLQKLDVLVSQALQFSAEQLRRSVGVIQDSTKFARCTLPDGSWKTVAARDWTSGFFPGSLWYLNEYSKDPFFKNAAEKWTAGMAHEQFDTGTHDVGFKIFCSYGNGYRLYPSDEYKKIILQAAQTLSTRFNATVGCIKSWDNRKWEYPVIIDNMMNLELLFWSAENGGSKQLRDIAIKHAETTMKNHFRPDGSTYHVLGYDTTNGSVVARNTHQGYADESAWARGQAWAIYGYTMTYRFTHDKRFLQTAQRAADYFISHLPADNVAYWDFLAPEIPNEPRDVSAAAITSSALFELSNYVENPSTRTHYLETAEKILRSLCSAPYLAEGTNSHAILNHAVGSKPAKSEVDVSIIYGDYYFIEAMLRYLHRRN